MRKLGPFIVLEIIVWLPGLIQDNPQTYQNVRSLVVIGAIGGCQHVMTPCHNTCDLSIVKLLIESF